MQWSRAVSVTSSSVKSWLSCNGSYPQFSPCLHFWLVSIITTAAGRRDSFSPYAANTEILKKLAQWRKPLRENLAIYFHREKNNQTKSSVNKSKETTGLEVFTISKLILRFNYYSYCSGMFTTPPVCLPEGGFLRLAFPFPKSLQPLWRTKLHCWSSFTQEGTSKDNFCSNRTSVTELSK